MLDFYKVSTRSSKRGVIEVYPKFIITSSNDLMIRGGDFYAIWDEEKNLWSTEEQDVIRMIDSSLDIFVKENSEKFEGSIVKILHMWDADSGIIDKWHKYCQKQMRDNFHMLDEKLIFANDTPKKRDYASKILPYPLEKADTPAYDELMSVLYSDEERAKIEWAIGSIVSGESKKLQKFLVLYGAAGTGKSTVLNIIQQLFEGYYSVFDAKALGSANNSFALEAFKTNPLVAIQHDGDLSRIEDNTRLNSLVSHELMTVNEKFKSTYSNRFKSFLFMGTNKPVKITDAKSGLIRRLIDVSPTGNKVHPMTYKKLVKQIEFELGGIAWRCRELYLENPNRYDGYVPTNMLGASNDFYNFMLDSYYVFKDEDNVTLKAAWEMYKTYCTEANVPYPYSQRVFKEELRNYFDDFEERHREDDGSRIRNLYSGFKTNKFQSVQTITRKEPPAIKFRKRKSIFDDEAADYPAQYATDEGIPKSKWSNVKTTLSDLDTSKLHYVKIPKNHIVIDFDIPDPDGGKSFERNLAEASKWPPTYAELSKSEAGIHLHYIYDGDVDRLKNIYDDHIEIKVFTGNSALRRKLTRCNDLPIATINSGLPLKDENEMVKFEGFTNVKGLETTIKNSIQKKYHPGTKPSVDFIFKILNDAYESDMSYDLEEKLKDDVMKFAKKSTNHKDYCEKMVNKMKFKSKDIELYEFDRDVRNSIKEIMENEPNPSDETIEKIVDCLESAYKDGKHYDVSDMRSAIFAFAAKSTNHADYCMKQVSKMQFKSKDFEEKENLENTADSPLVFYDVEVFPNLFLVNWKVEGEGKEVVRMINPTSKEIEELIKMKLVGFNCRRYDNHILYGRLLGYDNMQTYKLSQKIVSGDRNAFFGKAYNLSYTDVYDFSSKKQSLKKFEIELGIHHKELGLPWDEDVPEEFWMEVAEYCDNDVLATEAVFNARKADFTARQILADVAGMTVNDTTNSLTTRIIFGKERNPQSAFNYRDMGKVDDETVYDTTFRFNEYIAFTKDRKPIFPGYKFDNGESTYRGEEVGEGGYVYAEPGIYENVALLDIASMHPSSIVNENLFGDGYTQRFKDILDARIAIKHKEFDKAKKMLGGKLSKYLEDESTAKDLAQALKIAINSVYGLTSAKFDNPFRDIRNKDNIVAKRGALFMVNLKHAVQERGFTVAHIKTDSIKIPDATPEIIRFVEEFGKLYGYNFEHEATYDKMCLVNNAVYIAKVQNEKDGEWSATGTQFQVPYVFKTLFSHEPILFEDLCETKSVTSSLYLAKGSEEEGKFDDLRFVGKVGSFCPMQKGKGYLLLREKDGKYYAANGTKGYEWMEAETVKELGLEDCIDISYYEQLADDAIAEINKFGDFKEFAK